MTTVADRDLRKLKKPLREAWRKMEKKCHAKWLYVFVTEGKRSAQRQKELYAQWRTKPGKIVTWTLHSRHMVGEAFDIAWDPKHHWSLYPSDLQLREQVGKIWESVGLERWGRWAQTPDRPHFQLPSSAHVHTPQEEQDIYKQLFGYFLQLIQDDKISKETIKNIPDKVWDQAKELDIKEIVVDYLETLDRNELAEEFVYMLVNLWKGKK